MPYPVKLHAYDVSYGKMRTISVAFFGEGLQTSFCYGVTFIKQIFFKVNILMVSTIQPSLYMDTNIFTVDKASHTLNQCD